MNISSEIYPTDKSNSSEYFIFNGTDVATDFDMFSVEHIISILLSFPTNAYVFWLIVTGTGNGLAAEFFSLNLSVCEIILCVKSLLIFLTFKFQILWKAVIFLDGLGITGRPLFQCLICVERYLAVVHPVTFLKFKPLRYKVMCCVILWVASFGSAVFNTIYFLFFSFIVCIIFWIAQFFLFLFIQLFSCLAVLRALKHSGPGERGRDREENNMKRKAFDVILITTVTMVVVYAPYIISLLLFNIFTKYDKILMCIASVFFTLAGLVQPFLFLFRVGKMSFIKCQ